MERKRKIAAVLVVLAFALVAFAALQARPAAASSFTVRTYDATTDQLNSTLALIPALLSAILPIMVIMMVFSMIFSMFGGMFGGFMGGGGSRDRYH